MERCTPLQLVSKGEESVGSITLLNKAYSPTGKNSMIGISNGLYAVDLLLTPFY